MHSQIVIVFILSTFGGLMAGEKQKLTMEEVFNTDTFRGKTVADIQWLPDSSAFTFVRENPGHSIPDIWRHEVATGKESMILAGNKLSYQGQSVEMSAYQTTGKQDHLLITGQRKQIWRHSYSAPYYLYQVSNKELKPLAGGDDLLQNVALAPDGKTVAYVSESNLYVADVASGKRKQLSQDGTFNILNGIFDWVYEEEFGRADAFRWSPDGASIAYWHTDQTRVKTITLLDELPRYSEPFTLKYPKVGEQNAIVKIGIVNITSGQTVWMDTGSNKDIYLPRIDWTRNGQLTIQRLNRAQNHLELLLADAENGQTRTVLEDKNEAWLDVNDDFRFLKDGQRFVWSSEKDGWRHIYLSDLQGSETQLTKGQWEVRSIIGVQESSDYVYFNAKYDSAIEQGLYRVKLSGGEVERLSQKGGWHSGIFSPNYSHYVGFSSDIQHPTSVTLHQADGRAVRVLEANKIEALSQYQMVYPEFGQFQTSDGTTLNCYMMKPVDFEPHKKYPVIVFGYGGPGSQMVLNRWGTGAPFRSFQRSLWHQYMTEQGYLVFCLDNRGTGGRGKAFKNLAYQDISKWAVHDQIEGAKHLTSLAYVDPQRIGFWGWSGGGYLTCMMLTRGADYYTTGIAVASVGDLLNYDTIWTERYMGLLDSNKAGYQAANVLSYTKLLKGKLMLVHGTGDDNVHPGNTWQMIEDLIAKNKPFEMMMYPNRNHRIHGGNTSRHLYTMFSRYFQEHL